MKKHFYVACAIFGLAFASAGLQQAQEKQSGPTIQVQIRYTGSGTVDEAHKIYVALWDNPDFTHGQGQPVAVESTASKNGMVTFSNVAKLPAYVSAAFDPTGKWDARSAPPAGSSLGMYSKTPGKPEPIEPAAGHTAEVEISFDDSFKVK
jgi:hypothetical protein